MNAFYIFFNVLIFATCISENLACTKTIKNFVDRHNTLRLQVAKGQVAGQPSTAKMKLIMWDNELAQKAEAWAFKNEHGHNPDKSVPSGRFIAGENLFWYSTTNRNYQLDVSKAVDAWFSEHVNYTYGPLKKSDFDGSKDYDIGHYTQLVWSDSIYVGCAVSQTIKGKWKNFFVVCNYGPTHNTLRLQVAKGQVAGQPSTAKMKLIMWDNELAQKAEAWAFKNEHGHNPDKSVPSGRFIAGENLFWYSTTNRNYQLDVSKAVDAWFSEHVNYTYGPLKKSDFDGSKDYDIGHYTQLVWSDSIYVGCAVSQTIKGKWKNFFVVCNYGPTGNYIGDTPYVKGGPSKKLICGCSKNDKKCNNCSIRYGRQC